MKRKGIKRKQAEWWPLCGGPNQLPFKPKKIIIIYGTVFVKV